MKILNAEEIRSWDQYTIRHEPIAPVDLMERAAGKCVAWLEENGFEGHHLTVFCGKGNNGGDGLAIARLWATKKYPVIVYILDPVSIGSGHPGTTDFQTNLARLRQYHKVEIRFVQTAENFHEFEKNDIIIDALFGSGLNRELEGVTAQLVNHMNNSGCPIIAIDIPSGLYTDHSSKGNTIIRADHTLSFQCFKPAFMMAENAADIGEVHVLDIGLHPDFLNPGIGYELVDGPLIQTIYKPRNAFAHKGNFGHALLVAGSYGKMGATVLSAKACMRSGVGLLTCHIPNCGYDILQTCIPEAMLSMDINSAFSTSIISDSYHEDLTRYDSLGIGPGIGTATETGSMLRDILTTYRNQVVLDADALNIMASQKELLKLIPENSILTPHPKEFERLFGETADDFERLGLVQKKAKELNVIIVLKGHYSFIATPSGKGFFNSTGNAGMATAGSGDVLTGILTGLLAQGYPSTETAILGVYLHGMAGDIAARQLSKEAMLAGDIIDSLGKAFLLIRENSIKK